MAKSFLVFVDISKKFVRITKTFEVRNTSEEMLGWIAWKAGWRRYVFQPVNETVFDASCLAEIAGYLEKLMNERRIV